MAKTFWKCKICGDIHYGNAAPELCPTCRKTNAYEVVDAATAKKMMGM